MHQNYMIALLLALCAVVASCGRSGPAQQEPASTLSMAQTACHADVQKLVERSSRLFIEGDFLAAAQVVEDCARKIDSQELRGSLKSAEVANFSRRLSDPMIPLPSKAITLKVFIEKYPAEAAPFAAKLGDLDRQVEQAAANEKSAREKYMAQREREYEVDRLANLRHKSPTIGMMDWEVAATKWGRPKAINRTTTTYGTSEQWVYDRGYLYFENRKLTAIQD